MAQAIGCTLSGEVFQQSIHGRSKNVEEHYVIIEKQDYTYAIWRRKRKDGKWEFDKSKHIDEINKKEAHRLKKLAGWELVKDQNCSLRKTRRGGTAI